MREQSNEELNSIITALKKEINYLKEELVVVNKRADEQTAVIEMKAKEADELFNEIQEVKAEYNGYQKAVKTLMKGDV